MILASTSRKFMRIAKAIFGLCFFVLLSGSVLYQRQVLRERDNPKRLTSYCVSAAKVAAQYWTPAKGLDDEVQIDADLDAKGKVIEMAVSERSKGTTKAQQSVLKRLIKVKEFGIPPKTTFPLKVLIVSCGQHGVDIYKRDNDYGKYMEDLQRRIKSSWSPSQRENANSCVLRFSILRDGSVRNVKVAKSSGDKDVDAVAIRAVESPSRFEELPPGSPCSVDIEFTFDYRVHGSGGDTHWPRAPWN